MMRFVLAAFAAVSVEAL